MTLGSRVRLPLLTLSCLLFTACHRNSFHATGYVASDGGPIGTWRQTPVGCTRDPADGASIGQSTTVATLLFEDPTTRNSEHDRLMPTAPNPLLRLQIDHRVAGYSATLTTLRSEGTFLDAHNCDVLRVTTQEQPPDLPNARPRLGGTLRLDCHARGGHVTGDLAFDRCPY